MPKPETLLRSRIKAALERERPVSERLLERRFVDPVTGCWIWLGAKTKGYGVIGYGGHAKWQYVHRLAAEIWLGFDLTSDLFVLHKCDNPPCFNPEHLFSGTVQDNQADMASKGRTGNRRLTVPQVKLIREALKNGRSTRSLAAEYGVSRSAVTHILQRTTYRWVE